MKIRNFLLALGSISLLVSCKNTESKKVYLTSSDRYDQVGREGELLNTERVEYNYDERGNCIEKKDIVIRYNSEAETEEEAIVESVVSIERNAYDENDNMIACDSLEFDILTGEQSSRFTLEWEIDENGNPLKDTYLYYSAPFEEPESIEEIVYYYNNSGVRIKSISFIDGVASEQVDYTYNREGLLAAKYFGYCIDGVLYPSRKYGYHYYEGTDHCKYAFVYTYNNGDYLLRSKDYFEYDENGLQTLYAVYEGNELVASTEIVFTSDVSYKEIIKMERPDVEFGVVETTEYTFLNHEAMITNDRSKLVSLVELDIDGYYSFTLPVAKNVYTYSYENGECSGLTIESIRYEYGTENETYYYLVKEVYHYSEL